MTPAGGAESITRKSRNEGELLAPAEVIVHAGAEHVLAQRHVLVGRAAAAGAAIEAAEIDVEVFGLGAPVARQREFDAAAHGPARIGGAAARQAGRGGADVARRKAAGDVGQETIECVAGAAAHRGEPRFAGAAAA